MDTATSGDSGRLEAAEDADIECLVASRRLAQRLRVAARRAMRFARRYRDEEGPGSARERACVDQALAWRRLARSPSLGPGVVRARAKAAPNSAKALPVQRRDVG
jgi:hypothetical protein